MKNYPMCKMPHFCALGLPKKGDVLVLKGLYYDFDKYAIHYPDATRVLDSPAIILQDHPAMRISLESHMDRRGNGAYNLRLSEHRAESAVQYLVQKGIARNRLEWRGFGETRLVTTAATMCNAKM
ncbi:OmpA family protein [Chitinophaga pollutisoli]|uniref:OmpA family protein n=1 Tax=Chitinophaga pollutisoli TaxID=3133966 RepID=A0ABZ2YP10_9BACT